MLATANEDIRSLRELITYGLKGLAAYSSTPTPCCKDDGGVDAFLQRAGRDWTTASRPTIWWR